ncbi:MAG: T9SS type A sorting domain-containing protein [Bacteroidales bacterium]|jgi:hypothetical protein|nr:T9SS type A sorting domain-containing protein [Bacteroidales bacterium]
MKKIMILLLLFLPLAVVFGQKSKSLALSDPRQKAVLMQLDKEKLLKEDAERPKGRLRCAILMPVDKIFPNAEMEEKIDGGKIYRFQVDAPGAEALNLYLENFCIAKGAELVFYNADYSNVSPVYTWEDNPDNGIFVTDHFAGDKIFIELFVPDHATVVDCFRINEAGYMYRPLPTWLKSTGFGTSEDCEVNVNCIEGKKWQQQKKGVARILLKAGNAQYWCTGSLLNNTKQDRTPYFITAEHCSNNASEADYQQWKFYFNYESPECGNPLADPVNNAFQTTGSTKLAMGNYDRGSDFLLLQLKDEISENPNLYFNGWTISESIATSGVGIHHPQGDIKKISTYKKEVKNHSKTHWSLLWAQTETNWGSTEGGSSGSPLFDQNKLIIGTLTGGNASCTNKQGYDLYGKMNFHWASNGNTPENTLKTWLNPDNKNITSLNGLSVNDDNNDDESKNFVIYPNPANDLLIIELDEEDKEYADHSVKLFDLMGKCVLEQKFYTMKSELEINIAHLTEGTYVVSLNNKNGVKTTKIVKKIW